MKGTPAVSEETFRRVDAAMPTQAEVGRQTDLIVQVRFANSPVLGLEDWPTRRKPPEIEQNSEPVRLNYPVDSLGRLMPARVRIKVVAPDFVLNGDSEHLVAVPPDEYSKRLMFLLTPRRPGFCRVNVEVYDSEAFFLGSIAVESMAVGDGVSATEWRIANLVLEIIARPAAQMSSPSEPPGRTPPSVRAGPVDSLAPNLPTQASASGGFAQTGGAMLSSDKPSSEGPAAAGGLGPRRVRQLAMTAPVVVGLIAAVVLLWKEPTVPGPWVSPAAPSTTPQNPIVAGEPPAPAAEVPDDLTYQNRLHGSGTPAELSERRAAPSPPPKPNNRDVPTSAKSGKWLVQVLVSTDGHAAAAVVKKLASKGYPAFLVSPVAGGSKQFFKVQVGRYANRSDAERISQRIRRDEQFECQILR
jgi:cell division septation protein DedD